MNPSFLRPLAVLAAVLGATGLTACDIRWKSASHEFPKGADPSAIVIGTPAAPPTGDPPGTTPVAANTTVVTKKEETEQQPSEGDNNSHSTLAQGVPQKSVR